MMAVAYPSNLPSPLFNGFSATQSQNYFITFMDYATKRRAKPTGSFICNFKLNLNRAELESFNGWYYQSLRAGVIHFTATWDFAGIYQELEYAFAEGGQPKYTPLSFSQWQVDLKVEVKTDIINVFETNHLNGFCPDIINCMTTIINLGK